MVDHEDLRAMISYQYLKSAITACMKGISEGAHFCQDSAANINQDRPWNDFGNLGWAGQNNRPKRAILGPGGGYSGECWEDYKIDRGEDLYLSP